MKEDERRRVLRTARELRKALANNPRLFDDMARAQETIRAVGEATLDAYTRYVRAMGYVARSVGGPVHIRRLTRSAGQALLTFVKALPPNWPADTAFDIQKAVDMANAGIPVVWLPPGPVMTELVAVDDYDAWVAVLRTHTDELRAAVAQTLAQVTHDELAAQVPLARAAFEAWNAGHGEAAQALAVTVTEALVSRYFANRPSYKQTGAAAFLDLEHGDGISISELRLAVALAPVSSFYTEWFPNSGNPTPCLAMSPFTTPKSLTTRRTTS